MTKVLNRFSALNPLRRQGGFTLIELLVVIAIIAVLAAVVLVALGNARTRARDARRVSDLNNVSLALEVYLDTTNSATYPAAVTGNPPTTAGFATINTELAAGNIVQGQIRDPLDNGTAVENLYRGQTNITNANATTVGENTTYLLTADLETVSTASCASDYDGSDIGLAAVGALDCVEAPTTGNCDGDDAQEIDYCICNGPACQ